MRILWILSARSADGRSGRAAGARHRWLVPIPGSHASKEGLEILPSDKVRYSMTTRYLALMAAVLTATSLGCCAVRCGPVQAPVAACDTCGEMSCATPDVCGASGCYRGPLSWFFDLLAVGYACPSCGERYWGDWGGTPAECENCDHLGNWTGSPAGTIGPAVVGSPVGGGCPTCGAKVHTSPVTDPIVSQSPKASPKPTPAEPARVAAKPLPRPNTATTK
ncbi:MAG: hypothetical protein D6741_16715 [Planctomycetota bacterium]|nr:MAG: hypothetical protein D6741_16715 [Planctomycetota bacterium]